MRSLQASMPAVARALAAASANEQEEKGWVCGSLRRPYFGQDYCGAECQLQRLQRQAAGFRGRGPVSVL